MIIDHDTLTLQTDGVDGRTDKQTDGQTDNMHWQYLAPLGFAR